MKTSLAFLMVLFAVQAAQAQTPYPMLMSLKPVATQVGQTTEHTVNARYSMYGAYKVLVTGDGVRGEVIHPDAKPDDKGKKPNLQTMKVRFTVAPDALPGVREFRVATAQGVSTVGQLVVSPQKLVLENVKNDTLAQSQSIEVPAALCGAIEKSEDVDYYKFSVKAGENYSFNVRSLRLQDKIHDLQKHVDPILTIRTATGGTLAASDNFFYGDPFLSHRFEQAGEYVLEIRDVRYQGNQYWEYCIEISREPYVTNVFPMGVTRGQKADFQLVGFQLPSNPRTSFEIPKHLPVGSRFLQLPLSKSVSNPVPVVVSELPAVTEQSTDNNAPDKGQAFSAPAAISGRIESENDVDYFTFKAKKGERFSFEVVARRQRSQLDPHLRIVDAKGKQLALNDDMRIGKRGFADSLIENWSAPADGEYSVEIRDLHLRGGEGFVYFIEVKRSQPFFRLFLDTDKTQLTPGTGGVFFVRIERKNGFTGEVKLRVDGLPEGVIASCGRILADGQDACVVLQAFPRAAMNAANITVTGTSEIEVDGKKQTITATAVPYQETYQPGGGRGHWPVSTHAVAIGAARDVYSVRLSETDITLKPGESKKIDVEIQRAPGFKSNVTLDVLFKHLSSVYGNSLPAGVTLDSKNSKTLLTGETAKGHITLKADAKAKPVRRQQIAVMASVSINFVMKTTYAGPPVFVTVTK